MPKDKQKNKILDKILLKYFSYKKMIFFTPEKINGNSACIGIICGFLFNLYCWVYLVNVSWLWWNAIGFVVTLKIAIAVSYTHLTLPTSG